MSAPFIWGVATAAYQIEGGREQDGRTPSMWDAIRLIPGRIKDGSPIDLSCDGRNKYKEDVVLIASLGVSHYRFSIDWSRVMKNGKTRNPIGMEYYKDLCKELRKAGIECIVTLFHADLPLDLYNEGSWLNEEIIDHFVEFCRFCYEELKDYVSLWITFNEIRMHSWVGIVKVEGEPFHSLDMDHTKFLGDVSITRAIMIASRNMLLAHAKVYRLFHEMDDSIRVGLIVGAHSCFDEEGEKITEVSERATKAMVHFYLDPLMSKLNDWTEGVREYLGDDLPPWSEEEKKLMKNTIDVLCLNYYRPHLVKEGAGSSLLEQIFKFTMVDDKWPKIGGDFSWLRFHPKGIISLMDSFEAKEGEEDNYPNNVPILISENGCNDDGRHNSIDDHNRIQYLGGHIDAVLEARARGVNVIGYTAWSLMDNLEWDDGFAVRFGLFSVNLSSENKERTPKRSVEWYKKKIEDEKKRMEI
ncbi:hypothetical protein PFISCL1PPCAC_14698 [Pristionchus fissidentatus]|uniref:Uncharacterized protein n=1 Tax=Pristionchus fissidentatus TaxID=1538716 RepID=A0AAV5VUJ9_9BILA|nr:hypothetical protein PFISCL1PPCAC_14698 [Pristionchus fissidentatus]